MLKRVKRGYKGLQGDTKGNRGLQRVKRVTKGYRWLQGVTKRLQGVTRG